MGRMGISDPKAEQQAEDSAKAFEKEFDEFNKLTDLEEINSKILKVEHDIEINKEKLATWKNLDWWRLVWLEQSLKQRTLNMLNQKKSAIKEAKYHKHNKAMENHNKTMENHNKKMEKWTFWLVVGSLLSGAGAIGLYLHSVSSSQPQLLFFASLTENFPTDTELISVKDQNSNLIEREIYFTIDNVGTVPLKIYGIMYEVCGINQGQILMWDLNKTNLMPGESLQYSKEFGIGWEPHKKVRDYLPCEIDFELISNAVGTSTRSVLLKMYLGMA